MVLPAIRTTEINGSFYRTPSLRRCALARADAGRFCVRLEGVEVHHALEAADGEVREQPGADGNAAEGSRPEARSVLFQLPAQFKANRERLASFLKMLSKRRPMPSSFAMRAGTSRRFSICCGDHNIALCLSDHRDAPPPWKVTAKHVYIRGHGPTGEYKDRYPKKTLEEWARDQSPGGGGSDSMSIVYFDNDQKQAPKRRAAADGACRNERGKVIQRNCNARLHSLAHALDDRL